MRKLDHGSHRPPDADAVAPHDHRVALAVGVEVVAVHRLGVFRPQLEDVADLYTPHHFERLPRDGTRIAGAHGGDVGDYILHARQVAVGVEVAVVAVRLVRADDEIARLRRRTVEDDLDLFAVDADGAREARHRARRGDRRVVGELQFRDLEQISELALVDLEVAADHREDQFSRVGVLIENRLAGLFGLDAEEAGDLLDGLHAGGGDLFERQRGALLELPRGGGDLAVRAVGAVGRREDRILAAVADRHELVRDLAAHHPGVGFDAQHVVEPDAAEDALVGFVGALIVRLQVRLTRVEAVRVLHRELAGADQPGARTRLVAVLGLDLVEHHGELLVAVDLAADERRHALLVGHGKQHRLVVAVLEAQELRSDGVVAPRLLPQVGGENHRHQNFLAVDAVHLIADDLLDLGDDPFADRQQRVDAGRDRADVPAADQKLMTYRFGVLRHFAQAAADHFAHSHDD